MVHQEGGAFVVKQMEFCLSLALVSIVVTNLYAWRISGADLFLMGLVWIELLS